MTMILPITRPENCLIKAKLCSRSEKHLVKKKIGGEGDCSSNNAELTLQIMQCRLKIGNVLYESRTLFGATKFFKLMIVLVDLIGVKKSASLR